MAKVPCITKGSKRFRPIECFQLLSFGFGLDFSSTHYTAVMIEALTNEIEAVNVDGLMLRVSQIVFNADRIHFDLILSANGPISLMTEYLSVLDQYSKKNSIVKQWNPQRYVDDKEGICGWVDEYTNLKVLILGDSFVIAREFFAERIIQEKPLQYVYD